jgi:hypothetical protein
MWFFALAIEEIKLVIWEMRRKGGGGSVVLLASFVLYVISKTAFALVNGLVGWLVL